MKTYIRKISPYLFLRLGMSGVYSVITAAIPFIIKLLLDGNYLNPKGITTLAGAYLGIVILGAFCQYVSQRAAWRADRNFYILMRRDVFAGMMRMDFCQFHQKAISSYVSMLNNDIAEMQKALENILMMAESSLHIIAYGVFLAILDWRILLVILFFSSMAILIPKVTGGELSERKKRNLDKRGEYLARAQDILSAFTNMNEKTRPYIQKHYDKKLIEAEDSMEYYGKYRAFSVVLHGTAMYLIGIGTFVIVGSLLIAKEITLGTAAAALSYVDQFVFPIKDILNCIAEVLSVKGVWKKLDEIISQSGSEKEHIKDFRKEIKISKLAVRNKEFCMEDVTVTFEKNRKYVITGGNGSGKSTLLKAVRGYLPYESGSIQIDGQELRKYDISDICEMIEQNQSVYDASVTDNITMFGCYDIEKCMDVFGEHPKIKYILQQPNAKLLSGGEKQIVILLKAIASGKNLLILDEALSAVDRELSEYMTERILEMKDKTVIAVTHNCAKEHLAKYDFQIELKGGKRKE